VLWPHRLANAAPGRPGVRRAGRLEIEHVARQGDVALDDPRAPDGPVVRRAGPARPRARQPPGPTPRASASRKKGRPLRHLLKASTGGRRRAVRPSFFVRRAAALQRDHRAKTRYFLQGQSWNDRKQDVFAFASPGGLAALAASSRPGTSWAFPSPSSGRHASHEERVQIGMELLHPAAGLL
jgi:hypothetical protein